MNGGVGGSLARSAAAMLASRGVVMLGAAAGLVTFARLVDAREFGALALATGVAAVAEILCDCGMSSRLVQERVPDAARDGAALGLVASMTLAVTLGCVAGALLWPGDATSAHLLIVLAPGLLAVPLRLLPLAECGRAMRFGPAARAGAVRAVVELAAGLGLVLAGAGVLGLAAGIALGQLAEASWLRRGGSSGRVRPRLSGWRPLIAYGVDVSGAVLLARLGNLAAAVLIERFLGAVALGLFDRGRALTGLLDRVVLEGIRPLVLPALRRSIEAGVPVERVYRTKIAVLTALCWPVFALMILCAEPLVATLLGSGWEDAVPVVQVLAAGGLFAPFMRMSAKMFAAIGRTRDYLRQQMTTPPLFAVLVGLGAQHSLWAACAGLTCGFALRSWLISRALRRSMPAHGASLRGPLVQAGLLSLAVLAVATVTEAAAATVAPAMPAVLGLALIGATCTLAWVATLAALRHPLFEAATMFVRGADPLAAGDGIPAGRTGWVGYGGSSRGLLTKAQGMQSPGPTAGRVASADRSARSMESCPAPRGERRAGVYRPGTGR